MANTERILKMENNLNTCSKAIKEAEEKLEALKAVRDNAEELFAYYGSEDWYTDRESEIPCDMPAGVLSEDLVYDEIVALRAFAFNMLETSTDILKNWI